MARTGNLAIEQDLVVDNLTNCYRENRGHPRLMHPENQ
jgi:hypothetical protein